MSAEGQLEFYCGSLGSGKTSFAFERGLEHLIKGGTVVTNIEFYPDKIADWMWRKYGLKFDPSRLIKFEDGQDFWRFAVMGNDDLQTMFILDEAHVEHGARSWEKTSKEETMFNTMVRKLRIHMIYITQDINNVDKQYRRMAQKIWYCRNARQMTVLGFIRFPFNLFVRVPYICGPGVPPRPMSPEITIKPMSWGMFNSHSLVGRAAQTFSMLKVASTSPLERIPKPSIKYNWDLWIPISVGLLVFFS